jgi:nucleoside-diphosphate-sugar epimerase
MIGDGRPHLQMVHLDDLTQGILCCGSRPEALGQVFLLAGPEAPTLNELIDRIAAELQVGRPFIRIPVWPVYAAGWLCEMLCIPFGIDPPLHRRRVGFFTHNREFDISKARRMIGYDPRVSLSEGLRRTIAWYRAQGLLAPASGSRATEPATH